MKSAVDQLLSLLQQALIAILRVIGSVWTWAAAQIQHLTTVPWQSWPLWKQVVLVLIAAAILYALFKVAGEFWAASERIVAGFAGLFTAFFRTLPTVFAAGLLAFGGLWVLANVDTSHWSVASVWPFSTSSEPVQR
jgi:hypothetical protein